jgi:hypothetical protein
VRRTSLAISAMLLLLGMLLVSPAPAAPPPIRVSDSVTVEATSPAGASVSYHVKAYDPDSGDPIAATCTPGGSGSGDFDLTADFPLGTTTVHCGATQENGDPATAEFTVTVRDTTPPSFGPAPNVSASTTTNAPIPVTYTTPTATDLGQDIPVSCAPVSGSNFPIGTSTVHCTADDQRGNTASKDFNVVVTLSDDQPPSFTTVPGSTTTEATGPGGAAVGWSIAATDNIDPSPTINCDHASGSTFPLGTTAVTCTATDSSGNTTPTAATFNVTVEDTTPPALSLPGNQQVDTESPGGTTVNYSASASDIVVGSISPSCNPASGAVFPLGTTTVTCTASDGHNPPSSGTFTVTVSLVDHSAPTFDGVPATIQREANGPLGSVATYTPPGATDNLDVGPLLVTCLPASGSTFPLGTTNVTCTATDSHHNVGTASFAVVIVDTTKPVLTPPSDRNIYATTPTGIPRNDSAVTAFLSGGTASDIVDQSLSIGNNAPAVFPVGKTIVTFTTADDAGNSAQGTAALTVFPMPEAGTTPNPLPQPPSRTPPDDVTNLKAKAGSRQVTLSWTKPTAADFDHVTITRTLSGEGASPVVYTGNATSYLDKALQNGIEYRYTVVSYNKGGDRSAGAVVVAVPKPILLLTPRDGARVKRAKIKTLRLSWARMAGADYYNAQLFYAPEGVKALSRTGPAQSQAEVKVLSAWPKKTFFVLKKTWKFSGVRYRLKPGLYRWYIWPGYGNRKEVDYGPLMGSSTFVVVP